MFYNGSEDGIMQVVPVNSPPPQQKRDEPEVKGIVPAQPLKEEATQPLAPLVFDFKPRQAPRPSPKMQIKEQHEPVFHERSTEERRRYCRRLQNNLFLYEVRMVNDRRRRNQRRDDITTAIDEIA